MWGQEVPVNNASREAETRRAIDVGVLGAYLAPRCERPMSTSAPPAKPAGLEPVLKAERPEDLPLIDALIERAFGPGRFVKTAERLRECNTPRRDLSLVAWSGGEAVGCVRMWPIHIG